MRKRPGFGNMQLKAEGFDAYKKILVESCIHAWVCKYADRVIEQVAEHAAIHDKKPATKSNVNRVETRATKRKSPRKHLSMMEDIPCSKRINIEVKEVNVKQTKR